jgi:alpha-1,4-galacturonosyltransferase
MKQIRRWQRILILALLSISVFAPLIFVSNRLKSITPVGRREFIEELSKIRFTTNDLRLSAIEHEDGEGLKGPRLILFKDGEFNSSAESDGGNTYKNREEQVIVSQKMTVSSDEKVCIYKYN